MSENILFSNYINEELQKRFPDNSIDFFLSGDWNLDESKLTIFESIARGAYGTVHKGEYNGEAVAIKIQTVSSAIPEECTNVMVELSLMQSLPHEKLVPYIGSSCSILENEEVKVIIVMKLCEKGSLRDCLKLPIPWKLRVRIALDVAWGIAFLHEQDILHRDIKTSNVLIDSKWRALTCDMSFACHRSSPTKMDYSCGTDAYMSPEVILAMDCDKSSDIFSFGVLLCAIITDKEPSTEFMNRTAKEMFRVNEKEVRDNILDGCPPLLECLAFQCCDSEESLRPGIFNCIEDLESILLDLGGSDFIFEIDKPRDYLKSYQKDRFSFDGSMGGLGMGSKRERYSFDGSKTRRSPLPSLISVDNVFHNNIDIILTRVSCLDDKVNKLIIDNITLSEELMFLRKEIFRNTNTNSNIDNIINNNEEHKNNDAIHIPGYGSISSHVGISPENLSKEFESPKKPIKSSPLSLISSSNNNNNISKTNTITNECTPLIMNEELKSQFNDVYWSIDNITTRLSRLEQQRLRNPRLNPTLSLSSPDIYSRISSPNNNNNIFTCGNILIFLKLFLSTCVVILLTAAAAVGMAMDFSTYIFPPPAPAALFILLLLALHIIAYLEAIQFAACSGSIINSTSKEDITIHELKFPRAAKCLQLINTHDKTSKFNIGKQFLVTFLIIFIAELTTFPRIPLNYLGIPSNIAIVLFQTGLPGAAIVLTYSLLVSRFFVEEYTLPILNFYGCEFCIRLAFAVESLGVGDCSRIICHVLNYIFYSRRQTFLDNHISLATSPAQQINNNSNNKNHSPLSDLEDGNITPTKSNQIIITEKSQNSNSRNKKKHLTTLSLSVMTPTPTDGDTFPEDTGSTAGTGIPNGIPGLFSRVICFMKIAISIFSSTGSIVLILYGISIDAYVLPINIIGAYFLSFILLIHLFYLEGLAVAFQQTESLDPDTFRIAFPRSYKIHKLINSSDLSKSRFMIGRQCLTVMSIFLLAQCFTFSSFPNPGWNPGVFFILIKSGLAGVVTVTFLAQILPRLIATENPLAFMDMYYTCTLCDICLWLDWFGVGHCGLTIFYLLNGIIYGVLGRLRTAREQRMPTVRFATPEVANNARNSGGNKSPLSAYKLVGVSDPWTPTK